MINSSPSLGYNGLLWSTAISPDWFIVSCSDCSNPFVNFYNRTDLSIGQTYAYPGPYGNSKINLAVYTNNFNTTNVFIGTSDSIDQVEFYQSSNNMWNFFPNVFEINSTMLHTKSELVWAMITLLSISPAKMPFLLLPTANTTPSIMQRHSHVMPAPTLEWPSEDKTLYAFSAANCLSNLKRIHLKDR